jgi:hypothetical protein
LGDSLELVDGGRPVDVGAHQQRALVACAEPLGQLARKRGLARALKAGEQYNGRQMWRAGKGDRRPPQELDELLVHDADHLLARGQALEHVLAHRPSFHLGDKVFGDRKLNVGLEQGAAHLAQAVAHIVSREPPLTTQAAEDVVESIGECFEQNRLPGG